MMKLHPIRVAVLPVIARTVGSAVVAAVLLLPRALQAEEVSDQDRLGEWDDSGERFGGILVHGELIESPSAPGGWTLVRTYENTTDEHEHRVVEERVMRTESMVGARVTPPGVAVVVRTQVLDLAPHEKKSIGTYLPAAIAADLTKSHRTERAAMAHPSSEVTFGSFVVDYLRPLAKGETVAKREDYAATKPLRMPSGPPAPEEPSEAVARTFPKMKPTARTLTDRL